MSYMEMCCRTKDVRKRFNFQKQHYHDNAFAGDRRIVVDVMHVLAHLC